MHVLLIDGLNLVRRIYAAVPAPSAGTGGQAAAGGSDADRDDQEDALGPGREAAQFEAFLHSLGRSVDRALRRLAPSHALAVFEGEGPSWRHRAHPAYKAGRPPIPAPLAAGMGRIQAELAARGVRSTAVAGYEADDVLASIATRLAEHGTSATILSTDKSMLTLLGPHVRVHHHFDDRDLDAAYVQERFGVRPDQLCDWLALTGDSGQGIPGVPGVGAKTATRLLSEHGTLAALLAAADSMSGRLGERLRDGAEAARLSRTLAGLDTAVETGLNLRECRLD